ncbi:MAG: T9SS type A sorting domain-containing protein [Saprospiraceae bacterium]|nr:T9SS type A sorting domain-containing protein [Saprospiraceae bacterium]
MKNILFATYFALSSFSAIGQDDQLRDKLWLFGYESNPTDLNFGGTNIDFTLTPPDIYYEYRPMDFQETNASVCDEQGNLLFYTNGIYVANKNHQQMQNGGGLSPGGLNSEWNTVGLLLPQGALTLPMPNHDSLYVLLHASYDLINFPGVDGVIITLYYSIINMNKNNGLGAVVEKNVVLTDSYLSLGKITATRHGNGRDWWILMNEFDTNKYFRWLLTPDGLLEQGQQAIGSIITNGLGQSVFSPDGSKFASINLVGDDNWGNWVDVYDFDRCTGLLSNQIQLFYPDTAYSGGVAFSPNSRFMYVSQYVRVFQFDLNAPDLAASRDTVAIYDGFGDPISTTFYLAQLAPDGKIYINSNNGTKKLHVINNPDMKGDSCNFVQHGIDLPTYNSYSMPNFPNFRLGKWEGSPCDTLIMSATKANHAFPKMFVYPNPAEDFIRLSSSLPGSPALHFSLFDATGRTAKEVIATGGNEYSVDVSGLAQGMYFYAVSTEDGEVLKTGKLIIAR